MIHQQDAISLIFKLLIYPQNTVLTSPYFVHKTDFFQSYYIETIKKSHLQTDNSPRFFKKVINKR